MNMAAERSISVLVALLCATLLPGAARAAADSPPAGGAQCIVHNGGFEDWQPAADDLQKSMDCPQVPTGWSVLPAPGRASRWLHSDAAVKHGGRFSVRLGNTDTKSGLSIAQRLDAEPEYRYIVRLWIKGEHIDAYHPKGIIVHVAASSQSDKHDAGLWSGVLRHSDKIPSPHCGTFDWHEMVCTFDTPVATRSLMLLVELRGAGVVWLDDVRVTRLEKCLEVESY
jgi:hypothetical protein